MNIQEFKNLPKGTEKDQHFITDEFTRLTNEIPELKEFRDVVEKEVWGFGERAFLGMHKMIVESFDKPIKFLEIGVYKSQILVLYGILSRLLDKSIVIYGITPLDSSDGHIESDYRQDIIDLHDMYDIEQPLIIEGLSQDKEVITQSELISPFDIILIDGSHEYLDVVFDINTYSSMVAIGGYLIMDDSANDLEGAYWGAFWGIEKVTQATCEFFNGNKNWEYIGNVVHNKIFKRIS